MSITENEIRQLGPQPIIDVMAEHNLNGHDLVEASTEQITHKMVARACKGRKLSPKVKQKITNAVNNATGEVFTIRDLFNY